MMRSFVYSRLTLMNYDNYKMHISLYNFELFFTIGDWSKCSLTCGGGTKQRSRTCQVPTEEIRYGLRRNRKGLRNGRNNNLLEENDDKKPCPGASTMVLFCNLDKCPPNTNWGSWGPWSECSKNCGGGTKTRKRTCKVVQR